jgi:hypothetical protein
MSSAVLQINIIDGRKPAPDAALACCAVIQ